MKTDKIGKDCWNGYGGGVESGETISEAASRELEEELGVIAKPQHLEKVAVMTFHNIKSDGETFSCTVHFFLVQKWVGKPKESKEMTTPTWFSMDQLPDKMMPADKVFVPRILSGQKIIGSASYGPYQEKLLGKVKMRVVSHFSEKD